VDSINIFSRKVVRSFDMLTQVYASWGLQLNVWLGFDAVGKLAALRSRGTSLWWSSLSARGIFDGRRGLSDRRAYSRQTSSRRHMVSGSLATRWDTNRQDLSLQLAVLLWLGLRCCTKLISFQCPPAQSVNSDKTILNPSQKQRKKTSDSPLSFSCT
jgi:hypothetical protein